MFIESLHNLTALDLGFRRDHMLLVDIDPTGAGYSDTRISSLYKNIEARLRSIPGVQEVSEAVLKPFGDSVMSLGVSAEGRELSSVANFLAADANYVSEGYFHTMEISLIRGRVFEESDVNSRRIAVISDNLAARLWPGEDAVGKHFRTSLAANALFEVIGVVKASKQREGLQPRRMPGAQVFFYAGQSALFGTTVPMPRTLYIRTLTDPENIAASVQSDIRSIDANIAIPNMVTMEEQVRRSPTGFGAARVAVIISAALGFLVLALALVGTFGSLSFMVGQRTQEIGIRMALGAKRSAVLKMIIGHGLLLASVGTIGGMLLGAEIGNLLQIFLFDVSPSDPLILIAVALLLLSTACLTCLLPARRATRIDPMLALKCE
jgi:putative ABC transport system permease protein